MASDLIENEDLPGSWIVTIEQFLSRASEGYMNICTVCPMHRGSGTFCSLQAGSQFCCRHASCCAADVAAGLF